MRRIIPLSEWNVNEFKKFKITTKKETENALSDVSPKLREIFYRIQDEFGEPIDLKSGVRDAEENKKAGGAKNSAHLRGFAIDIKLPPTGGDPSKVKTNRDKINRLIKIASNIDVCDLEIQDDSMGADQILGIGVYRDAEDLHIDNDNTLGRRAWGPGYKINSMPVWAKHEISAHLAKK